MQSTRQRNKDIQTTHGATILPDGFSVDLSSFIRIRDFYQLTLKLPDAGFHLSNGFFAAHTVILSHCNAASVNHQFAPTVQKIGGHAITTRNGGNALTDLEGLFHDPHFVADQRRRRPPSVMISIPDISTCLRLSLSLLGQAKGSARNEGQFTEVLDSYIVDPRYQSNTFPFLSSLCL